MKFVASKIDKGKGHQVTSRLLLSYNKAHFCQQLVDALLVLYQAGMILLQPALQRQAHLNNATRKIAMLLATLGEPGASNELRQGRPVSGVRRQHLKQDGLAVGRQLAVARELVGSQAGLPALIHQFICGRDCPPRLERAVPSQKKVQNNANSPHIRLVAIISTGAQRSDHLRGCSACTTAAVRAQASCSRA